MNDHCREAFEKWVTTVWRPDDGRMLLDKDFPQFAFAAWKAATELVSAQASAPEGDAVAWLEVEPGVSLEQAVGEHGMLIHSMQVHVGRKKPIKRQEDNGMFPLYTRSNDKAGEVDKDLYVQACEAVEEWKERALKAEKELERAVRGLEGSSTFMGEPAICTHQWIMKTSKGGCIDECTVCGKIRWHKPVVHAHDCNLNMTDVAQRMKGCDCGALSTHDKTKA